MANRQTRCAAGEPAIGDQRAGFAEALGFEVAGRVQHFLHAGATFGAFIADDDDFAFFHLVCENTGHGIILTFIHASRAGEFEDAVVHASGFDDTALLSQIARENGKAAILTEGMFGTADHTVFTVIVNAVKTAALAESGLGGHAAGGRAEEGVCLWRELAGDVPIIQRFGHCLGVHSGNVCVQQAGNV